MHCTLLGVLIAATMTGHAGIAAAQSPAQPVSRTTEVPFMTRDGYPLFGKLTLPSTGGVRAVVIYAQTAEGMTVDMKRPLSDSTSFNYFDLYADTLPTMSVGFFRYEGRGVRMGDKPPRFEAIDTTIFNTSTLDNKVSDLLAAVRIVRQQPGVGDAPIWLMGASEGTLLIAEAAARAPGEVRGLLMYGVLAQNLRETFRYIMSDGAFLNYSRFFDADKNGTVTPAEFEADPRRYRAQALRNAPFSALDRNGDSVFTVADMKLMTKVYLDAIDNGNFPVLDAWARSSAGVSTPSNWFADHFAHADMWSFVSGLDMPIALFHGGMDINTPIDGVRALEARAKEAGRTQMRFFYFDDLDHSLGLSQYFVRGRLPAGHRAIFDYIRSVTAAR